MAGQSIPGLIIATVVTAVVGAVTNSAADKIQGSFDNKKAARMGRKENRKFKKK